MNKKNFMDMMICSLSAAIIILCFTYMEQSRGRDTLMAVCGIVFLAFLLLAVTDSLSGRQKKRGNGRGIQELLLLDEEGNEISAWHIGGKTSLLIGRDEHKENVDINLQNTEYGGMADRQHAVLNYAAGQWYIEDLGSRNGVRIQDAKDGKVYQVYTSSRPSGAHADYSLQHQSGKRVHMEEILAGVYSSQVAFFQGCIHVHSTSHVRESVKSRQQLMISSWRKDMFVVDNEVEEEDGHDEEFC